MKNADARAGAVHAAVPLSSKEAGILGMLPFFLIAAVSVAVYWLLTAATPPFGDDVFLKYVFQGWYADPITAPRVTGFAQIIEGMKVYYFTFRGRVVAEGIAQVFAVYGKRLFDVLNALVIAGTAYLVYFHSNFGKKSSWLLYLLINLVFWFFTPAMMAAALWMVGSLCVCWPVFFALLFMVPYRILLSGENRVKHKALTGILLIPAGFLAGTFNEQSFIPAAGFAVLVISILALRRKRLPLWTFFGLFAVLCGAAFVILAPGSKAESLRQYGFTPFELFVRNFPGNIFDAFVMSLKVTKFLLPVAASALVWLVVGNKKPAAGSGKKRAKAHSTFTFKSFLEDNGGLLLPAIYFILFFISAAASSILPYMSERLFYNVFAVFVLVLFGLLAQVPPRLAQRNGKPKKALAQKILRVGVPLALVLVFALDFGLEFRVYRHNYLAYNSIVSSVQQRIAAGEKDVVIRKSVDVRPYIMPNRRLDNYAFFWSLTDVGSKPDEMINRWYAYCLGADSIRAVE